MASLARDTAAAVARSVRQREKPLRASTAAALTSGYLTTLKNRRAEVGVWEIRGRIMARLAVACRDARLSGAEWAAVFTVCLHLQHLGRTKGMMTIKSLADDCMVTERTVRNALRVLAACGFLTVKYRPSGQITIMLARRFSPRAPVPGNQQPGSPRRSAARKKISTKVLPLRSRTLTNECTDSAPSTARRESTASAAQPSTANGNIIVADKSRKPIPPSYAFIRQWRDDAGVMWYEFGPHDPPRKRAPPVASG